MLFDLDPVSLSYLGGSVVVFVFGVWDDARNVGHRAKFIGQFLAVAMVVFYGDLWIAKAPVIGTVPAWIGKPFTFFAIIGMINALNTSDGLDGLAAGESLLSLLMIAVLSYIAGSVFAVAISTAIIGSILGFLRYNTYPAQVFLGDSGSQFLGFTLGFLAVLLTQQVDPSISPAATLLFLGLPIVDIIAAMFIRAKNGKKMFVADRNHIHHRLLALGFDHHETVVIIYLMQSLLVISTVFLRFANDMLIIGFYTGISILIFSLLTNAERTHWHMDHRVKPSRIGVMSLAIQNNDKIGWTSFVVVMVAVPVYMLIGSLGVASVPRDFAIIATLLFAVVIAELAFSKGSGSVTARGAIYVAAIFAVYLTIHEPSVLAPYMKSIDFGYFFVLSMAIALCVRCTRENMFEITPMDFLIVCGAVTAGILGGRNLQIQEIQEMSFMVIKAIILLYGCELLLSRLVRKWNILNISAVIALGVLGARGLFG
ncbi:MAG: MraY family glycosyltransferase [Gammaproteobacteria bacterium]